MTSSSARKRTSSNAEFSLAKPPDLSSEMWLAKRLRDHRGPDVFDGITDKETRKSRFREAVESCGLRSVVIGSVDGKPVNWAAAFERCYGEPL